MNPVQQLLTENIGLWTGADTVKKLARGRASGSAGTVYGIKKLRELVLELAVRGKLVSQDANDQPASALLQQIRAEKARLVLDGSIKKDKPLAAISDDEKPFELPPTWQWVKLGDITNFGNTIKLDFINSDTWVLDLEDIEKDTSKLLRKIKFSERESLSNKNAFKKGDVLYGKLRPYLNKVIVADEDGVCTTEVLPFRCYGEFNSEYLKNSIQSPYFIKYVNERSYGMKMPRLGTEDGRNASFPLAPLNEQHRIVAKVTELMALCDRLEAGHMDAADAHEKLVSHLLATLTGSQDSIDFSAGWQRIAAHFDMLFTTEASIDALTQTLLQLAVMGKLVQQDPNDEPASVLLKRIQAEKSRLALDGKIKKNKPMAAIADDEKPFELSQGWEWARFGEISTIRGDLVRPEDFQDCRQIAPDCIEKGTGRLTEIRTVKESGVNGPNSRFFKGQIVYSKIRPSLSKAVLVDFDGLCSADMYPIDAYIDSEFMLKQILSECFLKQVRIAENRIKMPKLNQESLVAFVLPLPPLLEQRRIVAKVDELMALCDQMKARIADAGALQRKLADVIVAQAVA